MVPNLASPSLLRTTSLFLTLMMARSVTADVDECISGVMPFLGLRRLGGEGYNCICTIASCLTVILSFSLAYFSIFE